MKKNEKGQGIAEYTVMLAIVLVIVIGVVRLIGSNALARMDKAASQISGQ